MLDRSSRLGIVSKTFFYRNENPLATDILKFERERQEILGELEFGSELYEVVDFGEDRIKVVESY